MAGAKQEMAGVIQRVVLAVVFNIEVAAKILGDMAGVYFIAVAGIVAAFFGAQAIAKSPPKK